MSKINILYVEDDDDWQVIFKDMIVNNIENIRFDFVKSLKEALNKLKQDRFHILIFDLSLPDSSFEETIEICSQLSKEYSVIVVSSLEDEEIINKCLDLGFEDYLIKDQYNEKIFSHVVNHAIRTKYSKIKKENDKTSSHLKIYEDIIKSLGDDIKKQIMKSQIS